MVYLHSLISLTIGSITCTMFENSIFLWDTLTKVKERQDFLFLFLKEEVLSCKMSHASSSKALQRVSYEGSILTLFEH